MNSLLKRQLRKYLSDELAQSDEIKEFIEVVDKSYENFDNQFIMQQRAMSLSSDELYEANTKLQKEAKDQKTFIEKLKCVLTTLKNSELPPEVYSEKNEIDIFNLIDYIGKQTEKIVVINKQREEILKELEYQNQELSDYAHMVSHDLKSPLRSIQTLVTWVKEDCGGDMRESSAQKFDLIVNQVEKMDALINGILEYSSIGKTKTTYYPVNLDNLVDEIINGIGIPPHILVVKTKNLPSILGDKYRFQQLFQNLINNAIKYNNKDQVLVEIDVKEEQKKWLFSIKDNGVGIDKAYYHKIFQTFETLDSSNSSTGIGLSIVRKIIDQYGGEIWVESELNKGTTFYFTIKK